jgi:hypothetical protein
MPTRDLKPKNRPEIDHRKAVISLRWLLVILASYLTVFTYIGSEVFPIVFGAALIFALTNIALMLIPARRFLQRKIQQAVAIADAVLVSLTLYLLRVSENYLFVVFIFNFCSGRRLARSASGPVFFVRCEPVVRHF